MFSLLKNSVIISNKVCNDKINSVETYVKKN